MRAREDALSLRILCDSIQGERVAVAGKMLHLPSHTEADCERGVETRESTRLRYAGAIITIAVRHQPDSVVQANESANMMQDCRRY